MIPTCAGRAVGVGSAAGVDAERSGAGGAPRDLQGLCMPSTGEPAPEAAESEGRGNARVRARNARAPRR